MKYTIQNELEQFIEMLVSDREIAVENGEEKNVTLLNNYIGDMKEIIKDEEKAEQSKSRSEVDEMLIDLLSQAVDEYNELQKDEAKRLDWWDDVVDNIGDRQDEDEIRVMLCNIRREIDNLKR